MTCFNVNSSFSLPSVTSTVIFRSSTNPFFDITAITKWTSKIFRSFTRNGMTVLLLESVIELLQLPGRPLFGVHITKVWNLPICPCLWPVTYCKVAFRYLSVKPMSSGLVLHAVLFTDLFNRHISRFFNPHSASPPSSLFLAQQHFLTVSLTADKQHTI